MESVNRQYGINAKRCMESSRKKCTIGDAIRLRQFHTRQSVMPYQAYGLNKNNLNCPFRFNLGYFWCRGRDLNPHVKKHRCLRPACLPIPTPLLTKLKIEIKRRIFQPSTNFRPRFLHGENSRGGAYY